MLISDLGDVLPALLDALGYMGTGVMVVADRGNGLERWYINTPVLELLGYSLDELRAIPVLELLVPEQRPLVTDLLASFRAGQPVPPMLEFTVIRNDGTLLPIELALGHVRIPDGMAYALIVHEVSAHRQARLSLLEADRIGLVGALSAGFAHEIKNPLTAVLLNLILLRRQLAAGLPEPAQPQAMRYLDDITVGAERILNNVRALETLATRGATAAIDLAAVVSATLRLAAPTLEPRANVIRQIFPVGRVIGEEARIRQAVLAMLLFSSSGFTAELTNTSNYIVVCVEQRDADVVLEVSDNGGALTPEETRHAFDRLYRSSAPGARVGVELGVARSVATAFGGDVTLAPRPGGGAVITMRLPAAP
jgi:PAS domain S-box-containing protein